MNLDDIRAWYDFTGRTFVVTGGTGVLGGAVAAALANVGAQVVVLSRRIDPAAGLAPYPSAAASGVLGIHGDVLQRASLEAAAAAIGARFGGVDGLINAAGGNSPAATTNPKQTFFDLSEDALRQVFELNVLGALLPCQVFGAQMAQRGEGVILNFSSMAALRPLTNVAAYGAAKAGVTNATQWLAVHMAQHYGPRIRVNAVAPGFFLGEQNRYLLTDAQTGELTPRGRAIIAHTPMGRFGAPDDLLGTALWLLSPAAAFVTGITVPVDGGFSAFGGV